jgi:hypothetical protein
MVENPRMLVDGSQIVQLQPVVKYRINDSCFQLPINFSLFPSAGFEKRKSKMKRDNSDGSI